MPLKGANLAYRHYPDPALRPMADLDLLVHPENAQQALAALEMLGYIPLDANWKHVELVRKDNQAVVSTKFEHPENPRKVDLHNFVGELMGGPVVDITAQLWEGAVRETFLGEPVWLPHPDALWLHLLIHLSSSIWGVSARLIQLVDFLHAPVPEFPEEVLSQVDPRFTHLALAMLDGHFPQVVGARVRAGLEIRLPKTFVSWSGSLTLETNSYFGRATAPSYLARLRQVYHGQPRGTDGSTAVLLLPHPQEVWFARQGKTGVPGCFFTPLFICAISGVKYSCCSSCCPDFADTA